MLKKAKTVWKEYQLNKCRRQYEKKVEERSDVYGMWIRENETEHVSAAFEMPVMMLSDFVDFVKNETHFSDSPFKNWFCVQMAEGDLVRPSKAMGELLREDPDIGLCYADEDIYDGNSHKRSNPWFKPDVYAPDTLFSYFYFGSFLMINGSILDELLRRKPEFFNEVENLVNDLIVNDLAVNNSDANGPVANDSIPNTKNSSFYDRGFFYYFVFSFISFLKEKNKKIYHIPEVLFHAEQSLYWGYEPEYLNLKKKVAEYWFSCEDYRYNGLEFFEEVFEKDGKKYGILSPICSNEPSVTIIIPSKDHPDVLRTCIDSIISKTDYSNYDIVVVDNGSSEENKKKVEKMILDLSSPVFSPVSADLSAHVSSHKINYLYAKYDFNYAKMCNIGAGQAAGDFLLLLNDDMEILQPNWLKKMVGRAVLSHVGAVGAKLLYPNSNNIQHAGVYNLALTPEHMLMGMTDAQDYYFGKNIFAQDVIAVTAACLLLKKSLFDAVGGFCEELSVSYNDVDLCFSIYEKGFFNIICNDVVLYHHESLSRGADVADIKKWERQMNERKLLYARHSALQGKDPFYNPNLAGFKHQFMCNYLYDYEIRSLYNRTKTVSEGELMKWYNETPVLCMETIRREYPLDNDVEKQCICISGWAYVAGMDNAGYTRWLHLKNAGGDGILVEVFDKYREDVVSVFPDEKNIALAGFECRIPKELLKETEYEMAMVFKDRCSRQILYKNFSDKMEVTLHG